MSEEKIKVPASWQAGRDQEAQRRKLIGEWRQYLSVQQRKALDEEGAVGSFKSRLSVELLRNLTPDEREELMSAERAEYDRLRPLAEARRTQRAAYVKAGGDAEDFDAGWDLGGREETIALIASGVDFEPSPGQFNSPY
ncbi:MAG: hypothetical protein M3P49_04100 [Actinomycetota bacterium]|nr:hypothetical protein [Actinomycetota bacterium]